MNKGTDDFFFLDHPYSLPVWFISICALIKRSLKAYIMLSTLKFIQLIVPMLFKAKSDKKNRLYSIV